MNFDFKAHGRRARRKGQAEERHVAARLSDAHGVLYVRNLDESRKGYAEAGGDIIPDDGTPGPLCIQIKNMKRPQVFKAYEQALEAAGPGQVPVAFIKRNQQPGGVRMHRVAVLSQEDFLQLCIDAGVFDGEVDHD